MLTFDESTHTYRADGKVVPSVTQVLDAYTDLSRIPKDILERKRQIGVAVHKAIELDMRGDLDESSISGPVAEYFAGWLKFKAHSGFVCREAEQKVYSKKFGYAGTLDLVGDLPTGEALIDAKTTTMLYPAVGPQTAAYAMARGTPKIPRYALLLDPSGKYNLEPLTNKGDWAVFQAALVIHYWRKSWK